MIMNAYIEGYKRRRLRFEKRLTNHFFAAKKTAETVTQYIIKRFKPERLWLYGSILDEDKFSMISDIDIATEGIEWGIFFKMVSECEKLTDLKLDIIDIESIPEIRRRKIFRTGRLIYENKDRRRNRHSC
jgi:predicted nucleotidyltransferase